VRLAAAAIGVAFGFLLSWGQATSPDRIRDMLLLEDAYLYLMLGSGVAVATVGTRLLRRARARALVTGEPVGWERLRPERRHIVGSAVFGLGWAISDACPGPIAAQVGQGFAWSLFTLAGVMAGVALYLRLQPTPSPSGESSIPRKSPPSSPVHT
jgi:uncharacterized membrane protein YedE/YeeE